MISRVADLEFVYPDDGCAAGGPSCLDCKLPECVFDTEGQARKVTARETKQAAFRADYAALPAYSNGVKLGVERLATQHGIGRRTAYRWAREGA